MRAKERHRCKLIEYLGNPGNEFPTRLFMNSDVIGFKDPTRIYKLFTPDELCEIEREALTIRRKKYSPEIAKVDKELLKTAQDGDVAASKLCYQRFEDWGEKKKNEHTGKDGESLINTPLLKMLFKEIEDAKGPEYLKTLKEALISNASGDPK